MPAGDELGENDYLHRFEEVLRQGLVQNGKKMVTVLVSQAEFNAMRSEELVDDAFGGSLSAFLVAFGSRKKLADKEIEELHKLIDDMRG